MWAVKKNKESQKGRKNSPLSSIFNSVLKYLPQATLPHFMNFAYLAEIPLTTCSLKFSVPSNLACRSLMLYCKMKNMMCQNRAGYSKFSPGQKNEKL